MIFDGYRKVFIDEPKQNLEHEQSYDDINCYSF